MDFSSSASGMSVVVPAYFVCAGILLYTALIAAVVGFYRGRVPLYMAFTATCVFSAAMAISQASYYISDSVAGGLDALRWYSASSVAFLLSLFVFIGLYTEAPRMRRAYAAAAGLTAVLLAVCMIWPQEVRFASVTSFGWTYFSWGEALFHIEGRPSAFNLAVRLIATGFVLWALLRLLKQYRAGAQREALFLAVYLLLLFGTSVHGALIDWGMVTGFHSIAFALVGLALLMGINLFVNLAEQNDELMAAAAELRAENERRRAAEAQIRQRAYHDALTGLPNRLYIQEHLAGMLERGQAGSHGAVLLVNLDHFKMVNDALSHAVGDQLLIETGRRLAQVASGSAAVARMAGDEFMLVLERLFESPIEARSQVDDLADAVSRSLARPMQLGDQAFNVLASMGIANFAVGETSAGDILARADIALHQAKKRGGSTIQVFLPDFQHDAERRFQLIDGLRSAISGEELVLHFQPNVDTERHLVGAEALLRWRSASLGAIPPAAFIPLAEETGLIQALGEWSLRRGCERLAEWSRGDEAFQGTLAINVSPWQLARPDFVARLRRILSETRADARRLVLEITESAVLYDVHDAVAKLREVREGGTHVALDDFGTGFSSLSLIKDLPIDAIKIDQSFVRNLAAPANTHLVRVIVAIGHELSLEVVAEGVETSAEFDALKALGCERFQGYLFSRPLAEPAFLEWARAPERLGGAVTV